MPVLTASGHGRIVGRDDTSGRPLPNVGQGRLTRPMRVPDKRIRITVALHKPLLVALSLVMLALPLGPTLGRNRPVLNTPVTLSHAGSLASQPRASRATGTVNGIVLDSKHLLAGASITCTGANGPVHVRADRLGDFQLHLAPGRYRCVGTAPKHAPSAAQTIRVKANSTIQVVVVLKLSSSGSPPGSGSGTGNGGFVPTPRPTTAPRGPVGGVTCSWKSHGPAASTDTHLLSWSSDVRADPGVILTISGMYPAARYVALQAYAVPDGALLAALPDTGFPPAPRSTNPFVAATARGAGSYLLHLIFGPKPRDPTPGTMYANVAAGTAVRLWYLLYLPDLGSGDDGNAGLPQVTAHFASDGFSAGCPIPGFVVAPPVFATPISRSTAVSGTATVTATMTVSTTPSPQATGTVTGAPTATRTPTPRPTVVLPLAGFARTTNAEVGGAANPDAADLSVTLQPGSGLYVARFRAPLTLSTLRGGAINGSGQVRYWSFCIYDFSGSAQTCFVDEQTPVGPGGVVTVVMGSPSDQPPNTAAGGAVIWVPLNWPFLSHTVVYHQLLPLSAFASSIARVPLGAEPGPYMGAYAPTIVHCTTAEFQANGCS